MSEQMEENFTQRLNDTEYKHRCICSELELLAQLGEFADQNSKEDKKGDRFVFALELDKETIKSMSNSLAIEAARTLHKIVKLKEGIQELQETRRKRPHHDQMTPDSPSVYFKDEEPEAIEPPAKKAKVEQQ